MKYTDEFLNGLDAIAQITLTNIYTLTKNHPCIVLENFDLKDKNDLFMIRIATIAKDILNKPIKVRCKFWDWIKINWKFRKISRFKRANDFEGGYVNVKETLEFMRPALHDLLGDNIDFSLIYETFYEVGKEKNYED